MSKKKPTAQEVLNAKIRARGAPPEFKVSNGECGFIVTRAYKNTIWTLVSAKNADEALTKVGQGLGTQLPARGYYALSAHVGAVIVEEKPQIARTARAGSR